MLAAVLVVGRVVEGPYVAAPPATSTTAADPAGATRVLEDLEDALADGDAAAAAALAPAGDAASADLLESLVDNARRLRVRDLDLRRRRRGPRR